MIDDVLKKTVDELNRFLARTDEHRQAAVELRDSAEDLRKKVRLGDTGPELLAACEGILQQAQTMNAALGPVNIQPPDV